MSARNKLRIGVIGGANPNKRFRAVARDIGRMIAENDAVLVCGGLSGVMEEAAKGAKQSGGLTIGILPGPSPKEANPFIDIPLATGMGYTRNALVVMNSDVLIAIDGEYGTLTEIAYGIIHGKKVIGIETWDIKGITPSKSAADAITLALKE
jgi:uncharacterized protein (TIGR00725 family)